MTTLLERALAQGTPLIDGSTVTFIWAGAGEIPQLMGDFNAWSEPIPLAELEPGVWGYALSLPRDAYVEYAFMQKIDIEERYR